MAARMRTLSKTQMADEILRRTGNALFVKRGDGTYASVAPDKTNNYTIVYNQVARNGFQEHATTISLDELVELTVLESEGKE